MESLKVASLFCGCGGTDVGLLGGFDFLGRAYARNPMEIVYANDIEESACRVHVHAVIAAAFMPLSFYAL